MQYRRTLREVAPGGSTKRGTGGYYNLYPENLVKNEKGRAVSLKKHQQGKPTPARTCPIVWSRPGTKVTKDWPRSPHAGQQDHYLQRG